MAIAFNNKNIYLMYAGINTPPSYSVPLDGMITWFDASDYTSGATWVDRSVNGLDLTLSGTYSLDSGAAMSGSSVNFSAGWGITPETALITGSVGTSYTYIEILKPTTAAEDMGTFAIDNQISNYFFGGGSGRIYGGWVDGTGGVYTSAQNYATTKTSFVSRRITYGFTTTSNMIVDIADSNTLSLTKYTSFTNALGTPPYNWADITGTNRKFVLAASTLTGGFRVPGYYAVSILYNRVLTDQEVTDVYNYYKSTYVLA